jgi:hypothetical protein
MRFSGLLVTILALGSVQPAAAQERGPVSATSPGGIVSVTLNIDGDGRALYAAQRQQGKINHWYNLNLFLLCRSKIDVNEWPCGNA